MDPHFAEVLHRVVETYRRALADAAKVRAWLASLGVANAALFDRFKVGWCAGTLGSMARGEVLDRLRLIGLLDAEGGERFEGCVTVPVFDERGAIVQIAGYAVGLAPSPPSTRPPAPRYARRTDGGLLGRGDLALIGTASKPECVPLLSPVRR